LTGVREHPTLRAVSSFPSDRLEVTLAGMRFHARVGILEHERSLAQPLEVDVTLRRVTGSAEIVDYREVYRRTRDRFERQPLDYLEGIASDIADALLALPGVASVRVAVRKPHVMLEGPLEYAEIVVERQHG
jgi:7,8-dihydroneopterin aldolase/epimerase/oxygenase